MVENIITVKDLSVQFGSNTAIDNVSFNVAHGDIAMIIGPNGCGKSTLVKAMLGLVPYKGEVRILGEKTKDVLSDVAYVPQTFSFDKTFPITVEEFLKLSPKANEARIAKALDEVGMDKYRLRQLGKLSGGQLQRVLIASAILQFPKVLFLDEPTSGIDQEGIKEFYEVISHLNKNHDVTIVMVSHEVNVVYSFAKTVICLNKDVVCFGKPKEVLSKEVFVKLYGAQSEFNIHTH